MGFCPFKKGNFPPRQIVFAKSCSSDATRRCIAFLDLDHLTVFSSYLIGWGVYSSLDICCAPGVGFKEGCSVSTATLGTAIASTVTKADGP